MYPNPNPIEGGEMKNPIAKNLNINRSQRIEGREKVSNPQPKIMNCRWCGKLVTEEIWADYVGGHLQCECGKNVSECCQGETSNV
jgi:hypothetical protein